VSLIFLHCLPDKQNTEKLPMHSPHISSTRHADVLVIGAGILGTFHAYYAAKKGYKTILLERNQFPSDASTRNFGMIVQTIVETDSEWALFARASREIYRTIQAETDITVKNPGSLYLASTETEQQVLKEFVAIYAPTYFCQYLAVNEVLKRYPFVHASYCQGALLFPNDLSIEPRYLLQKLLPFVQRAGPVEYIPQTTVVAVEASGQGYSVRDARGNIFTAEHIFVCSGAEYRTLFPEFFQASGLKVCKLQIMQTVAQPERVLPHLLLSGLSIQRYPAFQSCPSYSLLQEQPVDAYIRDYGIHLLFKQAADGTVIIGDSHEYSTFAEANGGEEYTSCHINEVILRYGQRMITLPCWELQTIWNGYYLIHPQRPIYSETLDGAIHIVTGIGGKGMSTGPGFAQQHIDTLFA
jgi:D-hydroxyproline dehydrogenase subunit beta